MGRHTAPSPERGPLTRQKPHRVELLAPAGGPDALVAAVNSGADAVYLGLQDMNARRGADNFDAGSLAAGVRFAHLRGVRVYLTANVVVLDAELASALKLVDHAWASGIDAVIVQDLGLLREIKRELPHVRIHASTQIDAMNPESVLLLAEAGAARVTLARELPIDAIAACAATGVEVETFVHGAICYCYSGQCLMSSLIGRRSANRGMCAQPCRLPYALVNADGAVAETPGRYVLSPKDMAGIAHLPALIEAGVSSLKIEGRMKAPEYVAVVTSVYRAALDRALADPTGYSVGESEWALLEEVFSRGFTDAYLTRTRDGSLMSHTRPNNRGVLLGRVDSVADGGARLSLERSLDPADTIEFWTVSGHFTQPAGTLRVDGRGVAVAPAGATVEITAERRVARGDRVFRVQNASMLDAARRTFSGGAAADHAAVPADISVRVRVGEPLRITVAAEGFAASAEGAPVEAARTKAIGADEIVEHVGRLGGSGYRVGQWQIELGADAGLGYSALHALRREALTRLDEERLKPWAGRRAHHPTLGVLPAGARPGCSPAIVATTYDPDVACAVIAAGADEAYLRVFTGPDKTPLPPGVRPLLPRVAWPDETASLARWLDGGPVVVGNLGLLALARGGSMVAVDWPLNALNAHSAMALSEMGATRVWASPELSGRQLAELTATAPVAIGCVVWGRLELMVAEQCALQAAGPCSGRCDTCRRRDRWWRLRDQKEYEFPVTTDDSGRSHIVNSVTLDLTRAMDEVLATGVRAVRIEFTDESPAAAADIVRRVRSAVATVHAGGSAPAAALIEPSTSGHFFRGVR